MEQSGIAVDVAQALFYTVATLAVIVGGGLAWRRFIREKPDAPRWELIVGEPRVRYNDEEFRFISELVVSNRSRSPQTLSGVWLQSVHPRTGLTAQPESAEEATEYFAGDPQPGRSMPPDSSLTFTSLDEVSSEPAIVRVEYAIDVGEATPIFGRMLKPVHHDDVALYRNS